MVDFQAGKDYNTTETKLLGKAFLLSHVHVGCEIAWFSTLSNCLPL